MRHLGVSTVRGAFTKVGGTVVYDAANLAKSSVQVTIDADSVDTRVQKRDDDLRSEHFFNVQKFPTITFQSTKVEAAGAGKLRVTGDLSIRGVTKPVTLDVDGPSAPMKDPWGNQRMGASATTKINRMDFGVADTLHGWRRDHAYARCGDDSQIGVFCDVTQEGGACSEGALRYNRIIPHVRPNLHPR